MKHNNTIYFDSSFRIVQGLLFVMMQLSLSSLIEEIDNEIRWPSLCERRVLAMHIPQLPSCIGFVDGSLISICRPCHNPHHD